jgi:plasminogen activator inhibitor 1 RNA-binding protein
LKKKSQEEALVPTLEGTRAPNEGADDSIWRNVVPLKKDDDDAYFVGKVRAFVILLPRGETLLTF